MQTQVWPLNFTNFSNVIFGGFLQFVPNVRRAALEPRTAFYNFTRLSLSAYFKLQLSLRSERVYTCLCRRDRQTSQVRHFSLILTIVVRVFFTNHKVLISSASLIPSLQTTRWKINQNIELYFFSKSKVKRNIYYRLFLFKL